MTGYKVPSEKENSAVSSLFPSSSRSVQSQLCSAASASGSAWGYFAVPRSAPSAALSQSSISVSLTSR